MVRRGRVAILPIVVVVSLAVASGCRYDAAVDPAGSVDSVTYVSLPDGRLGVRVQGWAADPDEPHLSLDVTVSVADTPGRETTQIDPSGVVAVDMVLIGATTRFSTSTRAWLDRSDVAVVHPRWRAAHGFDLTIDVGPEVPAGGGKAIRGSDIVVVAGNVGRGSDRLLGIHRLRI